MKFFALPLALFMASCSLLPPDNQDIAKKQEMITEHEGDTKEAMFAGGCFWCIESAFQEKEGVVAAISGFAGGEVENPSYELVSSGETNHRESVLVVYDPEVVSYEELVEFFWMQFDPTDAGGSFNDRGFQYSSAIYYFDEEQKQIAEASKQALENSGRYDEPIVTPIEPATPFYPAEEYHQDYYQKNPLRYSYYRYGSGRDKYIEETWGKEATH